MDGLIRQVDERRGKRPSFITIPEPGNEIHHEHITQTIEWWARQAFNLPTIEIRTDQRQGVPLLLSHPVSSMLCHVT